MNTRQRLNRLERARCGERRLLDDPEFRRELAEAEATERARLFKRLTDAELNELIFGVSGLPIPRSDEEMTAEHRRFLDSLEEEEEKQ